MLITYKFFLNFLFGNLSCNFNKLGKLKQNRNPQIKQKKRITNDENRNKLNQKLKKLKHPKVDSWKKQEN